MFLFRYVLLHILLLLYLRHRIYVLKVGAKVWIHFFLKMLPQQGTIPVNNPDRIKEIRNVK